MSKFNYLLFVYIIILTFGCSDEEPRRVSIPDFDFPKSVVFEEQLSAYSIYSGDEHDLVPQENYHLLELSSVLFTDYAKKQRLVKVPEGTQMSKNADESINFPDGTILVKTFFYYTDERDTSLGKRIIESRLMIKDEGIWNVATYVWNESQTDAVLELSGFNTPISWTDKSGNILSTMYKVPTENECIACHQADNSMIPLGTKLRNLNRTVTRNGIDIHQLSHLQEAGILSSFDVSQITSIVDYSNSASATTKKVRAYLEMNCAHCHNPRAWDESANQDLDFRYETEIGQTGILSDKQPIERQLTEGKMPFIGTTIKHEEGVQLVLEYLDSL